MGVDRRDYVIYGYKMPYDYLESKGLNIWEDQKYLPFIEEWKKEDYSIIYDQMCAGYIVFGMRIAYADQKGFEFVELPISGWPNQSDLIKDKFKEIFGISAADFGEPKVLLFTHYL